MAFAPCTTCRRHVRVDEPNCPFCGGSLGDAVNRAVPRARRAAILFGSAVVIAGCSGSGDDTNVAPPYGAPYDAAMFETAPQTDSATDTTAADTARADTSDAAVTDTSSSDTASGDTSSSDTGGAVPPYGAPFLEDSGTD